MEKHAFIEACNEGGRKMDSALSTLYDDYGDALVHDGVAALADRELARDLLQETLIRAWRQCASFQGRSELFPWLRMIFRNRMVDVLRRRRVEVPLPSIADELDAEIEQALLAWRGPVDATPEAQLQSRQAEACFRACAARFAKEQPLASAVTRWVAEDGFGPAEIAQLLGRSPGATREYMSQCRKKARVYFAEWYALTLNVSLTASSSQKV